MGIFKFQGTKIFNGYQFLDDAMVLITDEQGMILDLLPEQDAGDHIQRLEGILSPGFVNAHCHLELSHLKGFIPEHTGLINFVFSVMSQRHFPEKEILDAISRAEDDMLSNGIVAVGDICNQSHTLSQKRLQRMAYYNFIEVSGWDPRVAAERFERGLLLFTAFNQAFPGTTDLFASINPHAPYSVSEALWKLMAPYFPSRTITIHNQESPGENSLFQDSTGDFIAMYEKMKISHDGFLPSGKSSLQTYFHHLAGAQKLLLVHNTFTTPDDIQFVKDRRQHAYWCICINANLYIENTIPPIPALRKAGCQIVVGTDSLASNHTLSVLDELKTIHQYYPEIPLEEMLTWATSNGATALQMDTQIGKFKKGLKPGVILLQQLNGPNLGKDSTVQRLI